MRINYPFVLLLLLAGCGPAPLADEQMAQGWVAPPEFVMKFEERDRNRSYESNFREETSPPIPCPTPLHHGTSLFVIPC